MLLLERVIKLILLAKFGTRICVFLAEIVNIALFLAFCELLPPFNITFKQREHFLGSDLRTLEEAHEYCISRCAYKLSISSENDYNFVVGFMEEHGYVFLIFLIANEFAYDISP